ncbi:SDR family oxidoreductase [Flavobacterium sp.]|uniref:SDR family oxidoreductase n=1 Tax=Flavobacterium sp. TaxID=239 RepID=UPI003D6C44E6
MNLTKKIAIVTGAAQGIGAGIAKRLANDGFAVVVLDMTEEACFNTVDSIIKNGGHAISIGANVADENEIKSAMEQIISKIGEPNILVNNAGFARDVNIDLMDTKDWDDVINVHLRGSFLMVKESLPYMKKTGWGRIINISSISATGHSERANYCAAKAGMHGFIKSLAVELGPFGITANVVAPGLIVTAMTEATAKRNRLTLENHLEQAVKNIPVNRTGTPADIAHAVSFFVSEEASFVTGQVLYVAGMPVN